MTFNFKTLDLSEVEMDSAPLRIGIGEHVVKCTNAEIVPARSNPSNKMLMVDFEDKSKATIRHYFNVHNISKEATRIGLGQLKAFLHAAGHKSPDNPEDVNTIKNLSVKIEVKNGKPRQDGSIYPEIKSFASSSEKIEDEIPF